MCCIYLILCHIVVYVALRLLFSFCAQSRKSPFRSLYRANEGFPFNSFIDLLFRQNLYNVHLYLSFLPNREKWTYRFGCDFKSSNKLAALAVVAFRLLYREGSFSKSPTVLSFWFNLSVIIFTLFKVASTFAWRQHNLSPLSCWK